MKGNERGCKMKLYEVCDQMLEEANNDDFEGVIFVVSYCGENYCGYYYDVSKALTDPDEPDVARMVNYIRNLDPLFVMMTKEEVKKFKDISALMVGIKKSRRTHKIMIMDTVFDIDYRDGVNGLFTDC